MRQQVGIPARMTVTDQNGAAAQLTGAQYASVMGAYNAFQHRVKTSIVKVLSEVAQLPGGVAVQMRHSFGTNMMRVMVPSSKVARPTWEAVFFEMQELSQIYGFLSNDESVMSDLINNFKNYTSEFCFDGSEWLNRASAGSYFLMNFRTASPHESKPGIMLVFSNNFYGGNAAFRIKKPNGNVVIRFAVKIKKEQLEDPYLNNGFVAGVPISPLLGLKSAPILPFKYTFPA